MLNIGAFAALSLLSALILVVLTGWNLLDPSVSLVWYTTRPGSVLMFRVGMTDLETCLPLRALLRLLWALPVLRLQASPLTVWMVLLYSDV